MLVLQLLLNMRSVLGMAIPRYTLYDMPVSNNAARVRMILYYKDVSEVAVEFANGAKRKELGLFGKIPSLMCHEEGLLVSESDTIARFVGGLAGGSFAPAAGSLEALKADRICRHHDLNLAGNQGCLYKFSWRGGNWAKFGSRQRAVEDLILQLEALEEFQEDDGPYMLGKEPSQADVACFPTLVFVEKMLPLFTKRPFSLGPKLTKWWEFMTSDDEVGVKVRGEIRGALDGWGDRWDNILGAGLIDEDPETIFSKIIAKEIPATVVYEDEFCLAFEDVNPVAPVHILLIPKERARLSQLQRGADDDHVFILGHLMSKVGVVAQSQGLSDYRLVVNDGAKAQQTVFHLHLHIIGGRALEWPPG